MSATAGIELVINQNIADRCEQAAEGCAMIHSQHLRMQCPTLKKHVIRSTKYIHMEPF